MAARLRPRRRDRRRLGPGMRAGPGDRARGDLRCDLIGLLTGWAAAGFRGPFRAARVGRRERTAAPEHGGGRRAWARRVVRRPSDRVGPAAQPRGACAGPGAGPGDQHLPRPRRRHRSHRVLARWAPGGRDDPRLAGRGLGHGLGGVAGHHRRPAGRDRRQRGARVHPRRPRARHFGRLGGPALGPRLVPWVGRWLLAPGLCDGLAFDEAAARISARVETRTGAKPFGTSSRDHPRVVRVRRLVPPEVSEPIIDLAAHERRGVGLALDPQARHPSP